MMGCIEKMPCRMGNPEVEHDTVCLSRRNVRRKQRSKNEKVGVR